MKTAIVVGATGLIGRNLTRLLLEDARYGRVLVFVRRSLGMEHPKLVERLVDFDRFADWKGEVRGEDLFSCMGTTRRQAGSRNAMVLVDRTYPLQVATAARENGVRQYLLVSSSGADSRSPFFYLRLKGEMEDAVASLGFPKLRIFQPSLLTGGRESRRRAEEYSARFLEQAACRFRFLAPYRPVSGEIVARAMVQAANDTKLRPVIRIVRDVIFTMAEEDGG